MGGKEQAPAEGTDSASEQVLSAEAKAAMQPCETGHHNICVSAAPVSLPAPSTSTHVKEVAARSRDSTPSPQPLLKLDDGSSHRQQAVTLPSWAAPAARTPSPTAQEEQPWQEVSRARRKSSGRQTATSPGPRTGRKHGRGAPDQAGPAQSPLPRPRKMQAAARHGAPGPSAPRKAAARPGPQPVHEHAEKVPASLPALLGSTPQQPSQQEGLVSQLRPRPQASHLDMQHEPLQATAGVSSPEGHASPEHINPGLHCQSSSHGQVSMWPGITHKIALPLIILFGDWKYHVGLHVILQAHVLPTSFLRRSGEIAEIREHAGT